MKATYERVIAGVMMRGGNQNKVKAKTSRYKQKSKQCKDQTETRASMLQVVRPDIDKESLRRMEC